VPILADKTRRLRYFIVSKLTPSLFYLALSSSASRLPRPTIAFVKQIMNNVPLVAVEVGVAAGVHAESILRALNMQRLFLVDPYLPYSENGRPVSYTATFQEAIRRLQPFNDRIQFVRLPSEEAHVQIPSDLDFVYIDGNHSYNHVKRDIDVFYPKVRNGGVIGGHDFANQHPGVVKAVCEFASASGLPLMFGRWDWWFRKI